MGLRIACFGEVMVELIAEDVPGKAAVNVAGDTYNTAVYLRRSLGPEHQIDYVTALGEDDLSSKMLRAVATEGVGVTRIRRVANRLPGVYSIAVDASGERTFSYWRSASAARIMFETGTGPSFHALEGIDVLYGSGISLAILPDHTRLAFLDWLVTFRANGGLFAFDSNFRPALWEGREVAAQRVDAAWRQTDIALPSLDAEMDLFDESEDAVVSRFEGYALGCCAVKRGPCGPLLIGPEGRTPFKISPVRGVVDTTAAGDSFSAGFLAAYLKTNDPHQATLAGHSLSAQVIQHRGAIIPSK